MTPPYETREQEIAVEALCLHGGGWAIAKRPLLVDCAHGRQYLVDENGNTTTIVLHETRSLPHLYKEVYE